MEAGFIPHAPGGPEPLNADSFDDEVLSGETSALVEFWAARCSGCRRLAADLAHLSRTRSVRAFTLNVDEELDAALRHGVNTAPTVILFNGGAERGRLVGVPTRAELCAFLDAHGVE